MEVIILAPYLLYNHNILYRLSKSLYCEKGCFRGAVAQILSFLAITKLISFLFPALFEARLATCWL